jgi:hypothetical protein
VERHQLLNTLIDRYSYTSYLELGCHINATFEKIDLADKTGVDNQRGGNIRLSTSEFFSSCYRRYDLIFVDACHKLESVEHDIEKAVKHVKKDGCVVVHDCLPKHESEQLPERVENKKWLGEAWKAITKIRQRHDLDTVVVDADCGMAVIFKRQNTDRLTEIPDDLTWAVYAEHRDELLRVIKIDELIDFLPPVKRHRNIWISTIQEWGRIGHQFNDILAGSIIAEMFGFQYYYSGFVNQENLNYYLNFADMFPKFELEDSLPLLEFSTSSNFEDKWQGLPFPILRKMMRSIPSDTNLVLRKSTFFSLRNLYNAESEYNALPGLFKKQVERWRSLVKQTNLYQEITSDFIPKPGVLNVATYVRGGGSLHDNAGRVVNKGAYDYVVSQIQKDYPDHELNVVYYSQGPHNDLIGFTNEHIEICDNTYPRMYEVMRTFISADVFIAGLSSFSSMIAILRDGPNYFLRGNPWILPGFSRVVD